MRFMIYALIGLVSVILALMVWVRLAPHDLARWHKPISVSEGKATREVRATSILQVTDPYDIPAQDLFANFTEIATSRGRTRILTGSVEEGRITLISRSLFWGFPDYTTVEAVDTPNGARLKIYARSRFGGSDWGVNAKRVDGWLKALLQP